ncbi:MAG: cyclic pyranopterin monophosphate synthase MoaC [Dehalococcoidales bacterium]|nr:MAG: cyclic pyranopterin monophosphate synthase MoaC [Dehalococcoidales bacterium]
MSELSHLNGKGEARMVDVGQKGETRREAVVTGRITMKPDTLEQIKTAGMEKGDVLSVARVAGIMAAKRTPDLVPLCHPILIDDISVDFDLDGDDSIGISASVKSTGKTGAEMEALTAVSVAALTIYDMAKAVDRGMTITEICLQSKKGGKSGTYRRK